MSTCSAKDGITAKPRPVSVNGTVIARDEIARETQNHAAATPIEAWRKAARALAIRELLLQEARRLGVPGEPLEDSEGRRETDEEAMIRTLVERSVMTPSAGEDECRRYYDTHRARFTSGALYAASHILLPAAPADAPARAAAQARAETLIALLVAQPDRFVALAAEFSACPSREQGGSLGEIATGDTVPEFESVLKRADVGAVHPEPVLSRFGIHVIRLDARREGQILPYEAVRERIAAYLDEAVHRRAVSQYITVLASRADISGIDLTPSDQQLMH